MNCELRRFLDLAARIEAGPDRAMGGELCLPHASVGVMGDTRTYENVLAPRAVTSTDGMTGDVFEFPWDVLTWAAARIVNKGRG